MFHLCYDEHRRIRDYQRHVAITRCRVTSLTPLRRSRGLEPKLQVISDDHRVSNSAMSGCLAAYLMGTRSGYAVSEGKTVWTTRLRELAKVVL
jgi:hypothetical protein